jgi:glutaminyl-tRNA synthetase
VQATLHWVCAADAVPAQVRLYAPLFSEPHPDMGGFAQSLNPESLEVLNDAMVEPSLQKLVPLEPVQFERQGYFCLDSSSTHEGLIFNRTIGLRDTWAKLREQNVSSS